MEALYDDRDWQEEREEAKGRAIEVDRHAALESVNRGLTAMEQCLRRGDEIRARRYLNELVRNQAAQGLPDTDIHITKTPSKAAVLARDAGLLEWTEQLRREACRRNQQDSVPANGPADILKARGELDAAEQQYRANIERWPNNEVSRHGLANVLRKQGRHTEVLQLLSNPLQPVTTRDLYDLHLHGMILLELGRWDEALDAFERGLDATGVPVHQAAFRHGLVLMDLSRRDPEAAQQKLRDLPEDAPRLNVYRLHAAAGRRNEAEARALQTRLNADIVRMDFTTRPAFRELEAAYCLKGRAGICEPDEAAYRAVIDAEIEIEQTA